MEYITEEANAVEIFGNFALLFSLLLLGIALLPLVIEYVANALLEVKNNWEFKTDLYFLSPGQLPQGLRTSLLVINNTGEQRSAF